ncbi:MAG: response regulator, partial [Candidatus Aminicenantes bacterium]|nr:response regulator [Candidatus Aminicenantes bacterium]
IKKYSPTIMMLTSLGIRGDASRCQKLGISVYLVKPVKQTELLDAIMLILGNKEQQEESTEVITRHTIRERCQSLRILLAEDNLINQKVVAKFLEKMGYQVSIAQNGVEAVSKVKKENFDLILMDIQMPEMDGFEATVAIRKIEKTSRKHISIIALTAHALKGDREKCLNAGMDDYMAKPITSDKLSEKISGIMSKKQSKTGRRK